MDANCNNNNGTDINSMGKITYHRNKKWDYFFFRYFLQTLVFKWLITLALYTSARLSRVLVVYITTTHNVHVHELILYLAIGEVFRFYCSKCSPASYIYHYWISCIWMCSRNTVWTIYTAGQSKSLTTIIKYRSARL